jgi:hypothetical protein
VDAMPEIARADAIRCGSRAVAPGKGFPLHKGKRAVNLQFGRRVVTVQNRTGILSPSAILVDLPDLPDIGEAYFTGNILCTDSFQVRIGSKEELHFERRGAFSAHDAFRLLHPWIRAWDRSIAKAMIISLYDYDIRSCGLEEDIVAKEAAILRESSSLRKLAERLLGLGYGLTPSGDDFILGILAVMSLGGRDPAALRPAISRYENPFSRTILEDAGDGYFSEPLLSLMNHLACGKCPPDAIRALLRVGSSSGRDTLAGMYYALYRAIADDGRLWEPETGSIPPGEFRGVR